MLAEGTIHCVIRQLKTCPFWHSGRIGLFSSRSWLIVKASLLDEQDLSNSTDL
jgi:hypothetical protein